MDDPQYLTVDDLIPNFAGSETIRTCRFLHQQKNVQMHVKDSSCDIVTEEQLLSFLLLMRADALNRMPFFQRFEIDVNNEVSERVANALKDFFIDLAPHSNLTHLAIFNVEGLLAKEPQLSSAISAMKSIKLLHVTHIGRRSFAMISAMRSHLATADMNIDKVGDIHNPERPEETDFSHIVHHSRHTLKYLYLSRYGGNNVPLQLAGGAVDLVYPRLYHLDLEDPAPLRIADYVRAFPNLQSLITSRVNVFRDLPRSKYETFRAGNKLWQLENGSWTSLQRIFGSVTGLYLMGLTCQVPSLNVTDREEDEVVNPDVLRDVLDDISPSFMRFKISSCADILSPEYAGALTKRRTPPLQALDLELKFVRQDFEDKTLPLNMEGILVSQNSFPPPIGS